LFQIRAAATEEVMVIVVQVIILVSIAEVEV